jgi:hypothetical protein
MAALYAQDKPRLGNGMKKLLAILLSLSFFASLAAICFNYGVRPVPMEILVRIKELPDTPELRRDGKHVDVGYKFSLLGGSWIGYVSSREYFTLKDGREAEFLSAVGMNEGDAPATPVLWNFYKFSLGVMAMFGLYMRFSKPGAEVGVPRPSQQAPVPSAELSADARPDLTAKMLAAADRYHNQALPPRQAGADYSKPVFGRKT